MRLWVGRDAENFNATLFSENGRFRLGLCVLALMYIPRRLGSCFGFTSLGFWAARARAAAVCDREAWFVAVVKRDFGVGRWFWAEEL